VLGDEQFGGSGSTPWTATCFATIAPVSEPLKPIVLFLHLPKTAGVTLRQIVVRNYRPHSVETVSDIVGHREPALPTLPEIDEAVSEETQIIQGHMVFGWHTVLPRPATYFTFLREPVERVISQYHHIKRGPAWTLHELVRTENVSLHEYATSERFLGQDNLQTRLLAGRKLLTEPCTSEMLERAKCHLREHFTVVGLTERFDESLILLKRQFGWRLVLYRKRNVRRVSQADEVVDQATRQSIAGANAFDLELYEYARQLFEQQLANQRSDYQVEVEAFRRVNECFPSRRSVL
jgi:hypothetical protein